LVKGYVLFGIVICLLMGYANFVGWTIGDSTVAGVTGPRGPRTTGIYHK
jgi:hypothetical protein